MTNVRVRRWRVAVAGTIFALFAAAHFLSGCTLPRGGDLEAQCSSDVSCNDGNPCTRNYCDTEGRCQAEAAGNFSDFVAGVCAWRVCADGEFNTLQAAADTLCEDQDTGQPGSCDGDGACIVDCATDSDCPQAEVVCSSYQCNAATSKCELTYEPDGTVIQDATATNDCRLTVCDQQGADTFAGDKVHIVFAEFDSPCAEGVCNATGRCGECNFPNQCVSGGVANDCLTAFSCDTTSNICSRTCDAEGEIQDLSNELGNCQKRVCTSECGIICSADCDDTIEIDDLDLPTNVCETCASGEVVDGPNNTSPTGCDNPTYCFDGQCVGCVTDVECMNDVTGDCGTPKCVAGTCVADGNIDNGDVLDDMNECTDDVCTNGVPSNPSLAEGAACNGNTQVCDGAQNNPGCVDCTTNHLQHCSSAAGNCQQPACAGNNTCTKSDDNGDLPIDNNECTNDVCTAGVPSNPSLAEGAACNMNSQVCDGTGMNPQCVDCTTNHVQHCSSAAGNCQQPACDGNNNCTESDDNGDLPIDNVECTDDVCTAGVPSNPSATEGTACNNNTEVCNGAAMTPLCVECTPNFDANCPVGKECSAQTFKCVLL
ncbi:MAG: hypothetical protein VB934_22995 [Polyangiaceae bacterium]